MGHTVKDVKTGSLIKLDSLSFKTLYRHQLTNVTSLKLIWYNPVKREPIRNVESSEILQRNLSDIFGSSSPVRPLAAGAAAASDYRHLLALVGH